MTRRTEVLLVTSESLLVALVVILIALDGTLPLTSVGRFIGGAGVGICVSLRWFRSLADLYVEPSA